VTEAVIEAVTDDGHGSPSEPLHRPRLWWGLAVAALVTVTIASLVPLPPDLPSPPGEDLTLHVVAWAVLATAFVALARARPTAMAFALWGYSLALEVAQGTLTHRTAEWADGVANGFGVVLGVFLAGLFGGALLRYLDGRLSALIASMRA